MDAIWDYLPQTRDAVLDPAVRFLTGNFPFAAELQAFWMAVQGAVMVRSGVNPNKSLHWFHAFMLSLIGGYGGACFGFLWMAKPSSMLSNDLNMASVIAAFVLCNYTPYDFGLKLCKTLPVTIITTSFAQLFRALGVCKFVDVCFQAFKETPSAYYPIPVFGPIIYATLLGNMGAFLLKGFEGHIKNGVPWPVQNGVFCASFYHFYVNDTEGPIGKFMRTTLLVKDLSGLDDRTFAVVFVSLFMQVIGLLQLPAFLGPTFTPFGPSLLNPWKDSSTWAVGKGESEYSKRKKKKQRNKEKAS